MGVVRGLLLTTLAPQGAECCSGESGTEAKGLSLGQGTQGVAGVGVVGEGRRTGRVAGGCGRRLRAAEA